MTFGTKLRNSIQGKIGVCIGLDPIPDRLPEIFRGNSEPLYNFNLEIIEATRDFASAYKPNLAFYERFGASGWEQLAKTVQAIPTDKVVILDAKRGDIGSTSAAYADALFNTLGGDAATVSPYLGADSIEPFIANEEHGIFLLAVTSNPGGADFQELIIGEVPLYVYVIRLARKLAGAQNVGLVVGATRPKLWETVLTEAIDLPLLIPGVGAQGGDAVEIRRILSGYEAPVLVNSSRAIIHASVGQDFAGAARKAAATLFEQLNGQV